MSSLVLWRVASPMIGLGLVLTTLGVFAAWNIQLQQRSTADRIIEEIHSLSETTNLIVTTREIRYQLGRYLRSGDPTHLDNVRHEIQDARKVFAGAKRITTSRVELELLKQAEEGYAEFKRAMDDAGADVPSTAELERLENVVLTERIIQPLNACRKENQRVVELTNTYGHESAEQLASGLLLLGITGGAAGILVGLAVARGIGRSIVQLNVSVQSAASRIAQHSQGVSFTHVGDIGGIENNLRVLEDDIERVVATLQQREYELLRSEQLARVGQMAAGLAHELRNPLMPMKMLVQAALQPGASGQLTPRSLQILNDEILRLEETIQSFLDYARPRLPVRTKVDLRHFLTSAAQFVMDKAQSLDVKIHLHLPEQAIVADVDQNQLRQLFLNLVNNAMDAMGSGGQLDIILEHFVRGQAGQDNSTSQSQPSIATNDPLPIGYSQWAIMTFRDTGAGIAPEVAQSLFEPFVTTKETGTGLGLSICHQIALAHDGYLRAQNRTDRSGAEFRLLLPIKALP